MQTPRTAPEPLWALEPGICRRRAQETAGAGDEEACRCYRFSLPVAGFAPEELSVTRTGRRLTVRARHRRRIQEADGRVSHHYREVRKELVLPGDADVEALACTLRGERLCLEAPQAPAASGPATVAVCRAPGSAVGERKAAVGGP